MNVVFVTTKWNLVKIHEMNFIPQIGMKVDMWYTPLPKVKDVVCCPSKETLQKLEINQPNIDALVFVE